MSETCKWKNAYDNLWFAGCKIDSWKFTTFITKEYKFCPYCGKPLEADNGKDDTN